MKNQHPVPGNRPFQALIGCIPFQKGREMTEYSSDGAQTGKITPAPGNACRVRRVSGSSDADSASDDLFSGRHYQSIVKKHHSNDMKRPFLPRKGSLTACPCPEISAFGRDTAEGLKTGMLQPVYDGRFQKFPEETKTIRIPG